MANGPSTWQELLDGGTKIKSDQGIQLGIGMSNEIDSRMAHRIVVEGAEFADYFWPAAEQMVEMSHEYWRTNGKFVPNVTVRLASGGYIGGGLYHSQNIEGWLTTLPGIRVVYARVRRRRGGPAAHGDPLARHHALPRAEVSLQQPDGADQRARAFAVPFGKARVRRQGTDLTIAAYGTPVHFALEAATELEKDGKSVEVLDLRSSSRSTSTRSRVCPEDQPAAGRARGQGSRRLRRRDRLSDPGGRLRLARRADRTGRFDVHAGRVQPDPGAGDPAVHREGPRGRAEGVGLLTPPAERLRDARELRRDSFQQVHAWYAVRSRSMGSERLTSRDRDDSLVPFLEVPMDRRADPVVGAPARVGLFDDGFAVTPGPEPPDADPAHLSRRNVDVHQRLRGKRLAEQVAGEGASANSAAASNVNPFSISCETATEGIPRSAPSNAAGDRARVGDVVSQVQAQVDAGKEVPAARPAGGAAPPSSRSPWAFRYSTTAFPPISLARSGTSSVSACPAALRSCRGRP